MHGYNPSLFNRDHSVTGFLTQKFVDPVTEFYTAGGSTSGTSAPTILFRLAELYLNVAECHAALGNTQEAIDALNPVRERAGIPKLTLADITNNMTGYTMNVLLNYGTKVTASSMSAVGQKEPSTLEQTNGKD